LGNVGVVGTPRRRLDGRKPRPGVPRNGGRLNGRGDDKDLLRLAQRLRTRMAIDDDPCQFRPSRRLWSAVFESGTVKPSSL
jgi:hypothetical protein